MTVRVRDNPSARSGKPDVPLTASGRSADMSQAAACVRSKGKAAMDLKGAVALVTGGNGGLGQRICHALAREGADVAVMYARSRDQGESVASELTSRYQIKAQAFGCDITDGSAVDRLVGE